jgi:CheY-like chemotaxis protein
VELVAMKAHGDDDTRGWIQEIRQAGQKARELVGQILAFSRQSLPETRTSVSVAELLDETGALLRTTLPEGVELRSDIRSAARVTADPASLRQVVMSLCTNAIQAMEGGQGTLDIVLDNTRPHDAAGPAKSFVRLQVRDSGHGIPEEILPRIFEPCFTTRPGQGDGLGLTAAKGIVDCLGGRIQVRSEPGKGTCVDVFLPMAETGTPAAPGRPDHPDSVPGGGERILLVDDEEALAALGQETLSFLGYRASAVTSPLKGLELFRTAPDDFDLVISDLVMPLMSGETLAAELMKIRRDVPVILYSGFTDEMTGERLRANGIRAFLTKPIPMAELGETIRGVLDRRQRPEPFPGP